MRDEQGAIICLRSNLISALTSGKFSEQSFTIQDLYQKLSQQTVKIDKKIHISRRTSSLDW